MNQLSKKISVVIPVYNEEKFLEEVLDNTKNLILLKNYEAEIKNQLKGLFGK